MTDVDPPVRARRRRRAVGPPGAAPPGAEPRLDVDLQQPGESEQSDDDRLRREVPPHHGS